MGRRPARHRLTARAVIRRVIARRQAAWLIGVAVLLATTACAATTAATRHDEPTLQAVPATSGTLLVPPGFDEAARQDWLARLDRTAAALTRASLAPLVAGWDGDLLVELPPNRQWYARLAGPGSEQAAAVTRCLDGKGRITVNPVVADEDAGYLDTLVLHEGVHVATGSSCAGRADQWVEEGLAEWLACEPDPACLDASRQWVADHLAREGLPSGLPRDSEFTGSPDQVSAAYALARQAVASAVERLGEPAAMALFDSHYRGLADPDATRRLTAWYLADLQRFSGSAPR